MHCGTGEAVCAVFEAEDVAGAGYSMQKRCVTSGEPCSEGDRDRLGDVPGYVLTYFPFRGRAEALRLLLADQGIPWTEDEVQMSDWFTSDLKKSAVFGQLPGLADGDFTLYQSNTILRYLGRKHAVTGGSDRESALIDMVNDGVEDLRQKFARLIFFDYESGKEKYIQNLPNQLAPFERILSQNSKGSKFLVGDKISYADYNLLDILQCHLDLSPGCLSSFPLLSAHHERLISRPKLSEYLKSDGRKRRPITPKHK